MATVHIPESTSTVEVSIIDTTFTIKNTPASVFFGPDLKGFESFTGYAYAFLITHTDASTGKKNRVIFDLGPPKDWRNDLAPFVGEMVKEWGADIQMSKYVSEILQENETSLDSIDTIIWSHAHWDHTGRVGLFPSSVDLVVGPGIKRAYYPGYPAVSDSPILEQDFKDRSVTELDFTHATLTIGGFPAIDFFGDGSFYLLSAPGHAVGHINGLARTTATSTNGLKSTFILMGGDAFHHASQLRPSSHLPLPEEVPVPLSSFAQYKNFCPGHIFDAVHPSNSQRKDDIPTRYHEYLDTYHKDAKTTPYFTISTREDGGTVAIDLPEARATIRGLQEFDADENIFVCSAHDSSLYEVLEYFPIGANDWREKRWKEKGRWRFLDDFKNAIEIANGPVH